MRISAAAIRGKKTKHNKKALFRATNHQEKSIFFKLSQVTKNKKVLSPTELLPDLIIRSHPYILEKSLSPIELLPDLALNPT